MLRNINTNINLGLRMFQYNSNVLCFKTSICMYGSKRTNTSILLVYTLRLILSITRLVYSTNSTYRSTLSTFPIVGGGGVDGGSPCRMSIIRNGNVALPNLRKPHVALSNLRKPHVALSNLRKPHVALSNLRKPLGVYTPIVLWSEAVHLLPPVDDLCGPV